MRGGHRPPPSPRASHCTDAPGGAGDPPGLCRAGGLVPWREEEAPVAGEKPSASVLPVSRGKGGEHAGLALPFEANSFPFEISELRLQGNKHNCKTRADALELKRQINVRAGANGVPNFYRPVCFPLLGS